MSKKHPPHMVAKWLPAPIFLAYMGGIVILSWALMGAGQANPKKVPPLAAMPLALTNYWPFDAQGQPVAYGGQADEDPGHYANMVATSPSHAWEVGACVSSWVGTVWSQVVSFWWGGELRRIHCFDAFGALAYRAPFYHEGHGLWVIPVDILSPEPIYGLAYEWQASPIEVSNFTGAEK